MIEEIAAEYKIGPDEIVARYSPRQIADIYAVIQKRKMKEANLEYNVLRFAIGAAFSKDAPDKIIDINSQENEDNSGQNFTSIGLAADAEIPNPSLEVFDSTEEGGEDDGL